MPAREFIRVPITRKLLTRIFSKIKVSTEHFYKGVPCWEWIAALSNKGYGEFHYIDTDHRAHRVIYQLFVAPIPPELESDHLCRNRRCVNPVHIEPVTGYENQLRGEGVGAVNARKTHCPRGHQLPLKPNTCRAGERECKTCSKHRSRPSKAQIKEEHRKFMSLPYDHPRRVHRRRVVKLAARRRRAAKKGELTGSG